MTCGHCVSTITKALKAADKDAKVQIDLATHRVQIEPGAADAGELAKPSRKPATPRSRSRRLSVKSRRREPGSCCGCR